MSGSDSLHDVQGRVEEGDDGEAPGQAVLHELLGGGRAVSDHTHLLLLGGARGYGPIRRQHY